MSEADKAELAALRALVEAQAARIARLESAVLSINLRGKARER